MIELIDINKSYGNKPVLKGISFPFQKGKVYGIVGNNGAGKTTLFQCIAGLLPHEGKISSKYDQLKNYLGYLETDPIIMSYITGWEYLKLLCVARGIKEENFEDQNIFDLPLNEYADTYSTGMKKKLALMGVLLQKNDILILDEPFNGVDIQSNVLIEQIILELKNKGKTILISSHIFSSLTPICDEILLLSDGIISVHADQQDYDALEKKMKGSYVNERMKRIDLG